MKPVDAKAAARADAGPEPGGPEPVGPKPGDADPVGPEPVDPAPLPTPTPTPPPAPARARVTPLAEGPLLVEGPVEIVLPDGTVRRSDRPVVALCRCRRSLRDPFCDTSHRRRSRAARRTESSESSDSSDSSGSSYSPHSPDSEETTP
ncbi:CDGSH iron-sulfur domain-containing protein [Streptomyces filamentosus]|uniref:CDGSH iron-sulfur domain-containing protein n=1 Tax=Streptomyces filamentosus TaxID=67294 RepID=UPI0033DADF43